MVYLDNAATTPVCAAAAEAAVEVMTRGYGNPSSQTPLGRAAAQRLAEDRAMTAQAIGCRPGEVVFTSCGTEGDNWAVQMGVALGRRRGRHIITTAIEHAAVLMPISALEQQGYEVTRIPPDASGGISLEDFAAALRPDTALISMMLVNNETGSVLPVAQAAALAKQAGCQALFHTDAVQALLKLPFSPAELGVDLLTVSGHKIGAPKGVGAMYIRSGLSLKPLMTGGGQEGGLRPGTEATAQIAALAAACREGLARREENIARMEQLKAYTIDALARQVPQAVRLGQGAAPHILALSLPGYPSEVLVRFLGDRGICISAGSACRRGKASHVFQAMPLPPAQRMGALRVSFSPASRTEEADALVSALAAARDQLVPAL